MNTCIICKSVHNESTYCNDRMKTLRGRPTVIFIRAGVGGNEIKKSALWSTRRRVRSVRTKVVGRNRQAHNIQRGGRNVDVDVGKVRASVKRRRRRHAYNNCD